jgi:predicted amidohydrolase YtcJ
VLIAHAEVEGRELDLRIRAGRVVALGPSLARLPGEPVLPADGGALLPGLHDHHLHLFALAAARGSVACGPPHVRSRDAMGRALATASGAGWIRGIGYHESVAGPLDRDLLDTLVPTRPLRIQHRSGALWMLNSAACARAGLDRGADAPGVERDRSGRASGRLFGLDRWLRERLGPTAPPDLAAVGRQLLRFGVTGVTDATPHNDAATLAAFVEASERGALPQRIIVMGGAKLPPVRHPDVERGAVKLVLRESALPRLDELETAVARAHADGRPVAVHCVTRSELVLATAALAAAGAHPGDRIEHASVAPPDLVALVAELPLRVVTQPGFVRERGDAYLREVDPADRPWLYRCRGFESAGVPVAAGTDAPFGDPDPWLAMRAAVERRTQGGALLAGGERVAPERALALFSGDPHVPGAPPRRIRVGSRADFCLLDRPWASARHSLASQHVAATLRAGELLWRAG